jgi:anti-sigma factor RsiW
MNTTVTRDVITDLLPVYLSGEASADTKVLVESYIKSNPDFAQFVKQESRTAFGGRSALVAPDREMVALRRAKRRLQKKTWHLVLAIFFTFTTFAFSIEPTGITWTWEVSPLLTLGLGAVAALFWIAYFQTNRASRPAGV